MKHRIPHNRPNIGSEEIKAVTRVLRSQFLVSGTQVIQLQNRIKRITKTRYAIAVNSGLSALHLSLLALGVGRDDEVMLPTYTCAALLHAIHYCGAKPILVDCQKDSFNIDPIQTEAKRTRKTKAVIVPHELGFPAQVDVIKKIGIPIVEDCALALGTRINGEPTGSFGNISIFSFYATKMITSGQGGMVVTNNKSYFEIIDDLVRPSQRIDYKVRYNYQLTDIAASIANAQVKKLDCFIKRRRQIAFRYQEMLDKKSLPFYYPQRNDNDSNCYRFVLRFNSEKNRDLVKEKLREKGIASIVPIQRFELLHRLLQLPSKDFPYAEALCQTTLSLPMYPSLTESEVERILRALKVVLL